MDVPDVRVIFSMVLDIPVRYSSDVPVSFMLALDVPLSIGWFWISQ